MRRDHPERGAGSAQAPTVHAERGADPPNAEGSTPNAEPYAPTLLTIASNVEPNPSNVELDPSHFLPITPNV